MEELKRCTICEEYFPATKKYFYKNKKNSIDGMFPYCKECTKKKSRNNQLKDHEKYKAYIRNYLKENEDEQRIRLHNIRQRKKAERTIYERDYYYKNKDKFKKYREDRQHKHHDITNDEWESCKQYFNNECAYCGISEQKAKEEQDQYLHKEHVEHNGANDLSNCVPSCRVCNSRKWQHDLEFWYREGWCPNYSKERLDKIYKWLDEDYLKFKEIR